MLEVASSLSTENSVTMPPHEADWCIHHPRIEEEQLSTVHSQVQQNTCDFAVLCMCTRSPKQAAFRVAIPRASDSLLMRLPSIAACFSFLHQTVRHYK